MPSPVGVTSCTGVQIHPLGIVFDVNDPVRTQLHPRCESASDAALQRHSPRVNWLPRCVALSLAKLVAHVIGPLAFAPTTTRESCPVCMRSVGDGPA